MTVDEMFSLDGLVTFLELSADADGGLSVDLPSPAGPTRIDADTLRCSQCDAYLDPPQTRPARWLAWNQVLNHAHGFDGSLCVVCMADDEAQRDQDDADAADQDQGAGTPGQSVTSD
jgi:hypothetical protein